MVYWYYPSNRYGEDGDKDIVDDESQYDIDEYSNLLPVIIEEGKRKRSKPEPKTYEAITAQKIAKKHKPRKLEDD